VSNYDLSIVIPAFNEQSRIPQTLESLSEFINSKYIIDNNLSVEVLVVDDGSLDLTSSVVLGFSNKIKNLKLLSYPNNEGKGFAVKYGITNASGARILICDADGSTPFAELIKLYESSKNDGFDVVIGSRAINNSDVVLKTSLHRKLLGRLFSLFVRSILQFKILDTQCGFKLFTKESADKIFKLQTIYGFGFDPEILFIAIKLNFSVREMPVNWSNVPGSKVNLVSDSFRMLFDLFDIRIKDLRGLYKF
jgi:dolichyl-phosphate beta-glucosyltransferase